MSLLLNISTCEIRLIHHEMGQSEVDCNLFLNQLNLKKKRKKESILIDQRQLLWNIDFKIAASKNVYLHLNKITLDCYIIKVKSFTETVWKWVCESH